MKSRFLACIIAIILLFTTLAAQAGGLVVCSWNLKHLGWNNHKNLPAVAQILSRCDLVGLQEVMHPEHLQPLVAALKKETGEVWKVTHSHTVGGNGYKEGYAFVWQTDRVKHEGGDTLYVNPDHAFLRQPFSAVFQDADGSTPAFVAATVHIKFGDSIRDRTPEIRALASYWQWLGASFDNKPRILMGDFNLPVVGHKAWRPLSKYAKPYVRGERTTLSKKPGEYASAYDHFWVTPSLKISQAGVIRAPELLNISHKTAYAYLSDHVPIYLIMGQAKINLSPVKNPAISDRAGASKAKVGCVDLNKASVKRLATLVHVGPARAKAIVQGRPWNRLADLTKIRGLSQNRVADIQSQGRVCALGGA